MSFLPLNHLGHISMAALELGLTLPLTGQMLFCLLNVGLKQIMKLIHTPSVDEKTVCCHVWIQTQHSAWGGVVLCESEASFGSPVLPVPAGLPTCMLEPHSFQVPTENSALRVLLELRSPGRYTLERTIILLTSTISSGSCLT